MSVVALLRRNVTVAAEVTRILGLPDLNWTEVQVHFGIDEPAIAQVGVLLTPQQLVALATLAATDPIGSP